MRSRAIEGGRRTLRELLEVQDLVVAPGVWDGISAAVAERAGCDAVLSAGWAIAGALGLPDAELYSKSDNLAAVRVIADTTSAAIVADIDGGYGNAVNVFYALRDFERAGASAVLIEDQVAPKRCNYVVSHVDLNDLSTATGKVRAAVEARQSPDTMVIARTDAVGDEIFRRAEAYVGAGAEMICPLSTSPEFDAARWQLLHEKIGAPLMCALVPGFWQERTFTRQVMKDIGVRLVTCGLHPLYAATAAVERCMRRLLAGEEPLAVSEGAMSHEDFSELIGFDEVFELQRRYVPTADEGAAL